MKSQLVLVGLLGLAYAQDNSVVDSSNKCDITVKTVGVNPSRNSILVIDNQNQVHQFDLTSRKLQSKQQLDLVFPNPPSNIDLIVSDSDELYLLDERTFYSYSQGANGLYSPSLSKPLHSRVIFYPDSAINMNSDTTILINGGVYASYNLKSNTPNGLQNRDNHFANLPEANFTAIPVDDQPNQQDFWVFWGQKVADYNLNDKQMKNQKDINEFFSC